MKTTTLSLCLLATASLALIRPAFSDEKPASSKVPANELSAAVLAQFQRDVEAGVLRHIAPQVSLANRFSRTVRPFPSRAYTAEIVSTGGGTDIVFHVIVYDRTKRPAPKGERVAVGKYNGKTGDTLLFDAAKKTFVPAAKHPLIAGEKTLG